MTLYTLYVFGVAMSVLAVVLVIAIIVLSVLGSRKPAPQAPDGRVDVTVISMRDGKTAMEDGSEAPPETPPERYGKAAGAILLPALFFCGVAMVSMFMYCRYNSMALRHGAFDDYRRTETIAGIRSRSAHMFEDQSDELPQDLSGSILVFFKYTCDDCYDTHDQILETLAREGAENVYFVSSRSDPAAELIKACGVDAVPWAVYIGKDGVVAATDILYDEFEKEPSEKFIEENLVKIIDAQKGDAES